jgi:hypothetical protein
MFYWRNKDRVDPSPGAGQTCRVPIPVQAMV